MPHAIWNGSISFGLVTIPVTIFPAEDSSAHLSFHMLDKHDLAPVKQRRINSNTGEEIAWNDVVKGYELESGEWVVVTEDDFRAANVEATQTIDVLAAVCADEIDAVYLDKPYYLQPSKAGRKAYALLRESLARAERVALCNVVIRTREHLAALVPQGEMLLLELLRYPHELRDASGLDLPSEDLAAEGVTDAELDMAEQLINTIEAEFAPEEYRDTYRDDLLALIEKKAAGGEIAVPPEQPVESAGDGEVVDIMSLLKKSLEDARKQA
jgi:DNA end-binding protein Ku